MSTFITAVVPETIDLRSMRYSWLFLAMALFFISCNDDFKVGAPYKEVKAVYCLLSRTDTAHYVKVLKGYYDEEQDNLLLAQNLDSIYYDSLEVKMEEVLNGTVTGTFLLSKVDLNMEGYVKDSGSFATSPNVGYKFKATLNPDRLYRLSVKNKYTDKLVWSETNIISDQKISVEYPTSVNDRLNFAQYSQNYNFAWNGPANAAIFDVVVRLFYSEKDINTGTIVKRVRDLTLVKNVLNSNTRIVAPYRSEEFFRTLNAELGVPPNNINRYIDTPDVLLVAGGHVLKTFIDVQLAQGGGITYDQIKPNYTNFNGGDVYGIFSTRVIKTVKTVPFGENTVDSIISGIYTKNLRIVGRTDD